MHQILHSISCVQGVKLSMCTYTVFRYAHTTVYLSAVTDKCTVVPFG